jgi:hypothetical protein
VQNIHDEVLIVGAVFGGPTFVLELHRQNIPCRTSTPPS